MDAGGGGHHCVSVTPPGPGHGRRGSRRDTSRSSCSCRDPARPGLSLCYQAHVENIGWQSEVCDGGVAGTTDQSLRMEAMKIRVAAAPTLTSVVYQAYVQDLGWLPPVRDGSVAGTTGQGRRLEAIKISLEECPAGTALCSTG